MFGFSSYRKNKLNLHWALLKHSYTLKLKWTKEHHFQNNGYINIIMIHSCIYWGFIVLLHSSKVRKFATTKNIQKYKLTDSQNSHFCIHSASQRVPVHDKQRHIYVHRMNECKNDRKKCYRGRQIDVTKQPTRMPLLLQQHGNRKFGKKISRQLGEGQK